MHIYLDAQMKTCIFAYILTYSHTYKNKRFILFIHAQMKTCILNPL